VATFNRNQWQPSTGISGSFQSESVATFDRNTQQVRNPPRRTLCAQRLAVLMQRLRAASAGRAKEDRAHDT
jgi:hypothetical protein